MGRTKKTPAKKQRAVKTAPKATKRKSESSTAAATPVKKEKIEETPSTSGTQKVVQFTGTIPIDDQCPVDKTKYRVLVEGNTAYNLMLNQTNIGENNNKYYIMQILKHEAKQEYHVWFRWGRVGKVAGTLSKSGTRDEVLEMFIKKYREKTGNIWWFRRGFMKQKGKYDIVKIDYGSKDVKVEPEKPQIEVPSKLDKKIQDVIRLMFDTQEWEASIKELKFDVNKSPLGKLTGKQISAGYDTLRKIETAIQKKSSQTKITELCDEFYTRIPHDFGLKRPPLIQTTEEIKEKLELMQALNDIQIAINVIDEETDETMNKLDRYYKSLECELVPMVKNSQNYKEITKYVKNTYCRTYQDFALEVEDIFQVNKEKDNIKFKKALGTRMLLWHGSRLTNWCGILKQGLRIAPPEAPISGYRFGKGVYFADMVAKSADFCFTTERQPIGFLLVCEVALGNMNELEQINFFAHQLPDGKHSTKAVGRTAPSPKNSVTLPDGSVIPSGKPKPTFKGNDLPYNEYVVYNTDQIKPRFLVKMRFKY